VLRVKLAALDADNERRQKLAARYDAALAGTPFELPTVRANSTHVYHLYVVRTRERARVQAHLRERGIAAGIHYAVPVHLQTAYRGRIAGAGALPETERAALEVLSLPMYPELTPAEVDQVCAALRSAVS
jgi:dTDP-4-amino-4,6-dideoxygalactose transaminase